MSDKNHEQKNKFTRRKIIIKNLLESRNFRPFYYGEAVVISADACPPARANDTKRNAIWYSELYLPFFGRYANYPKRQGLPQKDEVFLREEEPQRRIPSTAKAVDEKQSLRRRSELYLFRKGIEKESTEVMNYVVFSMPHGEI